MKTKTAFMIAGAIWGALLLRFLFSRFLEWKPRAVVCEIRLELDAGMSLSEAAEFCRAAANAHKCRIWAGFNGVDLHACPGDSVLLVLQRYKANRDLMEGADKARELIQAAAAKRKRRPIPAPIPATKTATGRDLEA